MKTKTTDPASSDTERTKPKPTQKMESWKPIAEPADPAAVRSEVEGIAQNARESGGGPLAKQGGFEVYLSGSESIPAVMHEIGRLRETCFREVGEGTGKPLDLDEFDNHYLHLILWDPKEGRVAGGYRMGRTDTIMAEFGAEGLVTASFFDFEKPFLDFLNPGLELGRAFVASDYQKSIYPLALMWKGVGSFLVRYPRYHKLFGCVSISDDYTRISQDIMVRYMRGSHTHSELARWVHPQNAYPDLPKEGISSRLENIEQVSAAIANSEPDGKGVPVLLRQYLKLNATLLEFNVDPLFNNSLDCLVLVDMQQAPLKMLQRYLGEDGCKAMGR
ncbi:MAG: GNAT family N-acetyltransferase [Akkermansiaceae bacterium]